MVALYARGRCQFLACECGGFLMADFSSPIPLDCVDVCICGHFWWQHLIDAPNDLSHGRGGNLESSCGGFHPMLGDGDWSPHSLCACSKPWMSHTTLCLSSNAAAQKGPTELQSTLAASSSSFPATPIDRALLSSTEIALHPPINAFITPQPNRDGNANDRRMAAAQRSLPHIRVSTTRGRRGGARSGMRGSGGGHLGGRVSEEFSLLPNTEFLAVCLPFTIKSDKGEPAHPAPIYKFTLEEIASLIAVLQSHNLTCNLSLMSRGEVWRCVNDQLMNHLKNFKIELLVSPPMSSSPTISGDLYFQSPMILVAPRGNRQSDARPFVQTDLVGGDFKVPALVLQANKLTNPCPGDDRPVLFFAPRFRNLWGPVQDDNIPHPCFPWKAWHRLRPFSPTTTNEGGRCIQSCPGQPESIGSAQSASVHRSGSLRRARSDTDSSDICEQPPRARARVMAQENMASSPFPIVTGSPLPSESHADVTLTPSIGRAGSGQSGSPSNQNHRVHRSTPNQRSQTDFSPSDGQSLSSATLPVAKASFRDLLHWRRSVFAFADDDISDGLAISGPSAQSIATTLLNLLRYHYPSHEGVSSFQPSPGVTCTLQGLSAFVKEFHSIEIGTEGGEAGCGDGPTRAVFRAGVKSLIEDSPQWGRRGDHYHPILFPLNCSLRNKDFWAAGTWCALHLIHLGLAPEPISPWWLYAAVWGQDGLPNDLESILALDPASAAILEPWFSFKPSDVLGTDAQSSVRQLLIVYLDLNDSEMFQKPRSPDFHHQITKALISSVLVGHREPWAHPEFLAFREGLNLRLCGKRLFETLQSTECPELGKSLLTAMSNRRITSLSDVLELLTFSTKDYLSSDLDKLIQRAFQFRVLRWLHGRGHPPPLKGTYVSDDLYAAEEHDELIRARLLLRAVSDSDLIPLNPSFRLNIVLNIPYAISPTTVAACPPIHFHTCDSRMVVTMDAWVQNALRQPCTLGDEIPTAFDFWFHTQMLLLGYNRS